MLLVNIKSRRQGERICTPLPVKKYPCGESIVSIPSEWIDSVPVHFKITLHFESNDDLINLLLLNDAIRHQFGKLRVDLTISYFPYGRQDRRANYGDPHSLKVISGLINSCGFDTVYVVDPHSDVIEAVLDEVQVITVDSIIRNAAMLSRDLFVNYDALVSPDAGALKKAMKIAKVLGLPIIKADKVRDTVDGKLTGFEVHSSHDIAGQRLLIVDDICDGGGTFNGVANILRDKGVDSIDLYVTHGMFTKGLDALRVNFTKVICYNYFGSDPVDDTFLYVMRDKIGEYKV